tara:strand:- start:28 stop:363 length:336 start_codon:yes stop_codon:yes gene_type:complete
MRPQRKLDGVDKGGNLRMAEREGARERHVVLSGMDGMDLWGWSPLQLTPRTNAVLESISNRHVESCRRLHWDEDVRGKVTVYVGELAYTAKVRVWVGRLVVREWRVESRWG